MPYSFPPPSNAKPEAPNFPSEMYHMSSDRTLFQPPASYPDPPKDLHYQLPSSPRSNGRPKPIFPWEHNQAKPVRVFPGDPSPSPSPHSGSPRNASPRVGSPRSGSTPSVTTDAGTQPQTASPSTPTIQVTPPNPWASFSTTNAWDEMPEITRYIARHPQYQQRRSLQHLPLRKKSPGSSTAGSPQSPSTQSPPPDPPQRRPSLILTDFPTELERPSLPVTPAAVRRPSFWGQERDAAGDLPPAEGVPDQSQWDPIAKLLELQQRQSEILDAGLPIQEDDIPDRALLESSSALPSEESKAATAAQSAIPQVEVSNSARAASVEPAGA